MADRCEYDDCPKLAEGYVEAQWTIADFVRYEMCHDHLWQARDELEVRRIDDQPVAELGVHYYPPP